MSREVVECAWTEDTPDACWFCSGSACATCDITGYAVPCEHAVDERHLRPETT